MSYAARRTVERLESRHLLSADAALSGKFWFDANQNSDWDLDEVGLTAVEVYLDLNRDGQRGIDEPATFTRADDPLTLEDESGYYEFVNLEPGEYEVRAVLNEALEQTFPLAIPVMEDLIVNGSFEEAFEGWTTPIGPGLKSWVTPQSLSINSMCDGQLMYAAPKAPDGSKITYFAFASLPAPTIFDLYQDINLTAVPTSTLQFQYRVQWYHTCPIFQNVPSTLANTFSVQIRDPGTDQVLHEVEIAAITDEVPVGETYWQQFSLPLDDFAGRSVRISFVGDIQSIRVQQNRVALDAVQVLAPTSTEVVGSHTVLLGPGEFRGGLDFGVYSSQPLNTAPVLTGPAQIAVDEDDSFSLAGLLGISDADAADQDLQVTLSVDVGELVFAETEGVTVVSGAPGGDHQLLLQGDLTALNAALDHLTFTPPDNFHGDAVLRIVASDMGNTGLGGAKSAELPVPIHVEPVNDPPQVDVPLEAVVVQEGTLSQSVDVSQLFTDIDASTSGDELTIEVTANTNDTLVTTSWLAGELILIVTPGLSGEAVLTLTATDMEGASAEFSLSVTVLATSRISLNLARAEEFPEVGQPNHTGPGPTAIFHEWEDAAAELWITIQSDLPSGPFDMNWTAESSVPWVHQAELIEHVGTVATVSAAAHESGTRFTGRIVGVDLSGFNIGDRVLLATLRLPKNDEDPIGVPHNVEGAYASPTPHSGLTLTEAEIPTTQQPLVVNEAVPGHFLPVIFDADDNGSVGLSDFAHFVASFGLLTDSENPKAFRFDYDRSGRVGLNDFSTFVRFFGTRKDTEHGITIADLLAQEAAQRALSLEGEPMGDRLNASKGLAPGRDEVIFSAWSAEPRKWGVADVPTQPGPQPAPPSAAGVSPTVLEYGETFDPAVLDALWRDESEDWGWEDEDLDVWDPADESLKPEFSDWSEF